LGGLVLAVDRYIVRVYARPARRRRQSHPRPSLLDDRDTQPCSWPPRSWSDRRHCPSWPSRLSIWPCSRRSSALSPIWPPNRRTRARPRARVLSVRYACV